MNFDKDKLAYAISVINQIIIDGERYYIDDWTNALHYTKNVLESHLNGETQTLQLGDGRVEGIDAIIHEMNHTKRVMEETKKLFESQSPNNDDQSGDIINW